MFITFEGIDGSGKTTQARMFAKTLADKYNKDVLLTREPGGWNGGDLLSAQARGGTLSHPWSEAFLFMLDRCEHVSLVLAPALKEGKIVVCDRYHDSTLAYQVWGRGLPLAVFDSLAGMVAFPVPDVTFFFDIPIETALKRASKRSSPDAFEKEGAAFMERIREGYRALAKREPDRWITIDCAGCREEDILEKTLASLRGKGLLCE